MAESAAAPARDCRVLDLVTLHEISSGSDLPMKSIVVVGAQWGDEGKGKVVDYLAASFDYIARCAGGHNAGHTVIYNGNRFVLQLIPCGILRPGKHAVIGSGVVVDPAALVGGARHACEIRNRRHRTPASFQPRAPDFSVSPADGEGRRSGARRGENRHDVARNRPGVRRQDGAARNSRRRPAECRRDFAKNSSV